MPNCRIELFVTVPGYDPIWNIGEMGHIVGSSDSGPRPDSTMQLAERDDYRNLILLCPNCHDKIDGLKELFPVERLRAIKADHEAWVRTALPERGFSNVIWDVIRLQGEFAVDPTTFAEALSPDQGKDAIKLIVSPSRDSWATIQDDLRNRIAAILHSEDSLASRIAVFPLAPVSACIYLGYLLTNRVNVRAFQYHRDDATWAWPKAVRLPTSPTWFELEGSPSTSAEVFFLFELTAPIDASTMRSRIVGEQAVYSCSVPAQSTAWLKSKAQLDELARKAREMFELAANKYPKSSGWNVFYAGPAPGAVVVGQQLNPTLIPTVQCYEFQHSKHIPSVRISPRNSILNSWIQTASPEVPS